MSKSVDTPWKPATSTMWPASSASSMRFAWTSTIFALPCVVSVTMPACEPVSEMALWPRSWMAIAASAQEIRSPTEMSMSSSLGSGRGDISYASETRSSVESPIAERTATTRSPFSRTSTIRFATALRRSVSATEVPPNFMTSVLREVSASPATAGTAS
jgi:hypothetical protein